MLFYKRSGVSYVTKKSVIGGARRYENLIVS